MGFYNNFPYTNFHEMNLDWLLQEFTKLKTYVEQYTAVNKVTYGGIWNIEKGYPIWTIVTYKDASYMTIKPAPAGVEINNEEYWLKLADVDPRIALLVGRIDILEKDVSDLTNNVANLGNNVDNLGNNVDNIQWHYRNVKHYGAVGDGVTDCYRAFKEAMTGAAGIGIYVPNGTYYLSENPLIENQSVQFLFDIGSKFIGPGVGNKETGAGEFASTYLTNPWLVVAGDYKYYNLNSLPCPSGGAVIGDSKELFDMDNGKERRWYSLEYRGSATGSVDSDERNVELLNQVLNVTGFAGIAQEIDVNMYARPNRWSVGLFLTGRGDGGGNMTAIDITRDENMDRWTNALSIRRSRTGLYIDNSEVDYGIVCGSVPRSANAGLGIQQKNNGSDCIVLRRKTNNGAQGNFLVCWDETNERELFAIGIDGSIRGAGISPGAGIERESYSVNANSGTYEYTVPLNRPGGKTLLAVVETASLGFASPVWVTESTNDHVKVYAENPGNGSIKFAVLWQ